MGGYAAIIKGTVAERALQPKPARAGLFDRILGRTTMTRPLEHRAPDGSALLELPAEDWLPLAAEFGAFLRRAMPMPWQATRMFLEYLEIPTLEVQVRGARGPQAREPAWTLEFSFSGCAGMAEISAELGSHWVDKWFKKEGARIQAELLSGLGFHAEPLAVQTAGPTFVPFEGLGYGRRFDEPPDPEWEGSHVFEFDYSQTEALEQAGELESLKQLDAKFASLGGDGKCLCQLCSPAFTPPKP